MSVHFSTVARYVRAAWLGALVLLCVSAAPALAASTGCAAVETYFGAGVTVRYDATDEDSGDLYLDNLTFNAGETIEYTVSSSGSAYEDDYMNVGFGIYSSSGQNTHVELRSSLGNEIDTNSSFTFSETRTDYVVYAWGAWEQQDPSIEVTVTAACVVDDTAPSITSISPDSGTNPGGTPVTIVGTNLKGATGVTIGGQPADDVAVNEDGTEVTARTPAGSTGTVDVVVTTPAGDGILAAAFTYQAAVITLTPTNPDLPTGTVNEPYPPVTIGASGGTAPYTFSLWGFHTLPLGMTLDPDTGVISGTPTETTATGFDIIATDTYGNMGEFYFTMQIGGFPAPTITTQPKTVRVPLGGTAVFSVAAEGATEYHWEVSIDGMGWADWGDQGLSTRTTLTVEDVIEQLDGMLVRVTAYNADYSNWTCSQIVKLKITSGTPVDLTMSPASGALAPAMVGEPYAQTFVATGGEGDVTYSLDAGKLPDGLELDAQTGELTGTPASGSAGSYDFTIAAEDEEANLGTGSYSLVVAARDVTVTDKSLTVPAGSTPTDVWLEEGATGGPFTDASVAFVDPPAAGTAAIVREPAGGGEQGWYLRFVPDSTYAGTARIGFTLTSDLGVSNVGTVSYTVGLDREAVAEEIEGLVRGFVTRRQALIAQSIDVPNLATRRRLGAGSNPVTGGVTPSASGVVLNFATSSAQMSAAARAINGATGQTAEPFNIWVDGTLSFAMGADDGRWSSFGMVSTGIDCLLSDEVLVGVSLHLDRMSAPTGDDAELAGDGWLAGPYASLQLGGGLMWDTSLLYGGSANTIETGLWDGTFETQRLMVDTSLSGTIELDADTSLTPTLRTAYLRETVSDYEVTNGTGDVVAMTALGSEQFRVSLGSDISRRLALGNGGVLTPGLGLLAGVSGLDGTGLFGEASAEVGYIAPDGWELSGRVSIGADATGDRSVSTRIGLKGGF